MADKKTVKWLLHTAKPYWMRIGCLLFLQIVISIGAICYALVMKKMIDGAVSQNEKDFFLWLSLFALLIVVQLSLRLLLSYLEEVVRSGLENTVKQKLFGSLLQKDYAQVSAVHSEEWMNRMTSDATICSNGMTDIFPGFLGMMMRMIGAMLMIFFLQPKLAYIIIPGGFLFVGITLILRKYLKNLHKQVQEKDGMVRVYLQERMSSMLVLRAFGVEESIFHGAKEKLKEYRNARMKKAVLSNFCNMGFSIAINGMYLLGIGYCGYGILKGVVTYGTLTAMIQLIGQLQAPLSNLSGFVPRFYAMIASAERLMEVETYKETQVQSLEKREEIQLFYDTQMENIVFDSVNFSYQKESEQISVLKEVNLSIKKGDYVAITGLSGCGKSTLLKLLMGIYEPDNGTVDIVQSNNEKIPIKTVRRLFAYVPQGNYLMSGTIQEVITFGETLENISISRLEHAIKLACAEFIFTLSDGVDTMLGEKGAGLSEGQMQRIAIARALYANAPILILDEATSALDIETEQKILSNLKQLTNKTVFIVTHRRKALNICNVQFLFTEREKILAVRSDEVCKNYTMI